MNRPKLLKIGVICAGVVIALLVAASILVKVLISPEQVKKTVLPRISTALNRQVTLGDVSVSIFSGIRLHDLVIQEKGSAQPFLKAGALRLDYRFWPLLRKRIEIKEMRLESPMVRIIRYADGTFNFSDLTAKKEQPAPTAPSEAKNPMDLGVSQVTLTDGTLIFDDRLGLGGKSYVTEVKSIQLAAQKISLDGEFPLSLKAILPGDAALDITGTAAKVGSAPAIALTAVLSAKDLGKLVAGLPPSVAEKAQKFSPAGALELQLKLAGETKAPGLLLQGGDLKLTGVQVTAGGTRPSISGQVLLGKDSIESKDLTVTLAGQKLSVGLKGSNLMGKPVNLSLTIQGDKLDLNQVFPEAKDTSAAPAAATPKAEPEPMKLPLSAAGTVKVNSVVYRTLTIGDLTASWKLADNVFTLESLKGGMAGGSFVTTARVNLGVKGYSYRSQITVQGVQADKLVPAFAPKAAGAVFGTMGLAAAVQGSGSLPASLKRNLAGQGNFAITDGKLTGAGFVQVLSGFLNTDRLREIRFSRYDGTFTIKGGIVQLNSQLNGSDVRIKTGGTVDFDKHLNMSLDTRLSPAITGQVSAGGFGRILTDSQGWGVIPLRVGGSVGSPGFSLDAALAGKQLKGKLQEELSNRLLKGSQGQQGTQRPEQQLLERGLKGLLGN